MSNIQNHSSLKSSQNKTASELASEIFQGTFVESAYDKKGKFSHLLARLPQSEFVRLYSAQATATIFIHGYWLQLCLQGGKKRIINRETQIELLLEVAVNEYGFTELSFFRLKKRICRFKLKHISAADLLSTGNGFHCIARAAVKAFAKTQSTLNPQILAQAHLPVVLVLTNTERTMPSEFDRNRVLLQ
ncbi:MAG: hypothetical protein V4591_09240 [Bdellovibrionota bacterium]